MPKVLASLKPLQQEVWAETAGLSRLPKAYPVPPTQHLLHWMLLGRHGLQRQQPDREAQSLALRGVAVLCHGHEDCLAQRLSRQLPTRWPRAGWRMKGTAGTLPL